MSYDPNTDQDRVLLAACAYAKNHTQHLVRRWEGGYECSFACGFGLRKQRVHVEGGDILRLRRMVREGLVTTRGVDYDPLYDITPEGLARLEETTRPIKRRKPSTRKARA